MWFIPRGKNNSLQFEIKGKLHPTAFNEIVIEIELQPFVSSYSEVIEKFIFKYLF